MALTQATVTYDLSDLTGEDFDRNQTRVWVTTNIPGNTVIDTDGAQVRLGDGLGSLEADGTGSVGVWTPGDGSNPETWQTYIHVSYSPRYNGWRPIQRDFGPFTITDDTDLAYLVAEQEVPPTYLSQVTAELQVYVDQASDSADAAEQARLAAEALVLSDLGTTDGQTRALIENPASQTAGALISQFVSVDGDGILTLDGNELDFVQGATLDGAIATVNQSIDAAKHSSADHLGTRATYASSKTGAWDRDRSAYNFKITNTTHLRPAIQNAILGSGVCDILCIGDSETAYAAGGAAPRYLGMWPRVMARALSRHTGMPSGGPGIVPAGHAGPTDTDPHWTFDTWPDADTYRFCVTAGKTAVFRTGDPCTSLAITVGGNSGQIKWSIDGGADTTITPSGSVKQRFVLATNLARTQHTLTLTAVSTATIFLYGAEGYSDSGLIVHALGQYGQTASGTGGWADTSNALYTNPAFLTPQVNRTPALVMAKLGVNDIGTLAASDATITTALTTIRNQFSSSDFTLVGQYQPGGVSPTRWQQYMTALYGLADTLDCTLFDLNHRSGGFAQAQARGFMDDITHPGLSANLDEGNLFAEKYATI